MPICLSLNGTWNVTGLCPDRPEVSLEGSVPGCVHLDLLREGLLPQEPFRRDNAEDCQWPEGGRWTYERTFTLDSVPQDEPVFLEFDGVDTYAEVFCNGSPAGRCDDMFRAWKFDVTSLLRAGENTVSVRFAPHQDFVADKPLGEYPAAFGTSERVFVRRMQCTFLWDWVGRHITYGMWRDVRLVSAGACTIRDAYVYTDWLGGSTASLRMEIETKTRPGVSGLRLETAVTDPDGALVWRRADRLYADTVCYQADLDSPRLWWPNGMGDQPLYLLTVCVRDADGSLLDAKTVSFGVRTIRVLQREDKPGSREYEKTLEMRRWLQEKGCDNDHNGDAPGCSFEVLVNDVPVFCKGGNWVPADPFPSAVTEEKYDSLIRLAAGAGMNMLRCWGGGIYEPRAFWDACDRYGILIVQDVLMACARYPEDDAYFLRQMAEETEYAVRCLRNHPSLAWWCGDNENSMSSDEDDPHAWGRVVWEKSILPNLQRLEKGRPYFPTSPFGGRPNLSPTRGDTHFPPVMADGVAGDFRSYLEDADHPGRFLSESITFGAPNPRSVLNFMEESDVPREEMWEYHTKDNPHNPAGSPTLFQQSQICADKFLGPWETPLERIQKLEYVQYILVRATLEAARRNRFYCSGLLFWMYNDCWPASGWSLVDYYLSPKASYYAFREAAKTVCPSFFRGKDGKLRLYLLNDGREDADGTLTVRLYRFGEAEAAEVCRVKCRAPQNASAEIALPCELPVPDTGAVLVCDLDGDFGSARAYWYGGLPKDRPLGTATVSFRREGDALFVRSDGYAADVELLGGVFTDNYFDLLPGEEKRVGILEETGPLELLWLNR